MNSKKVQELLEGLRNDKSSGARELINKALEIIKTQLKQFEDPNQDHKERIFILMQKIIQTRPSMAPLINMISFLMNDLPTFSKKSLTRKIENFKTERERRENRLNKTFSEFLDQNKSNIKKIMTISYSSTVISQFLQHKDLDLEFYILESRPLFEGRRTAKILSNHFKTTLIVDAAMGFFIDRIDLIIFGVDSILKDGSIINKIGTRPLSIIGKKNDIKVYAVTDSYKYNLKSHYNKEIEIERKPSKEIYDKSKLGYNILNYYFDTTPPEYLTGIISDLGVLNISDFLQKIQEDFPINWMRDFKKIL